MKMHEHVICNSKDIIGSTQSNSTSTQSVQQSKHTTIMHEKFSQSPSQKFCKNLFDFEKPQIFQQIPKSRSECMKCMIKGLKRDHTYEICNEMSREDEEVE